MQKTCNKCGETKSLEDFPKRKDSKDGRLNSCKVCEGKRKAKYRYTEEQWKEWRLKKNYGITMDDYQTLLESQNHSCAICGVHIDDYVSQCANSENKFAKRKSKQNFSVDHCHTTGKIRGLLCFRCNLVLGYAQDNKEVLLNAVRYLGN